MSKKDLVKIVKVRKSTGAETEMLVTKGQAILLLKNRPYKGEPSNIHATFKAVDKIDLGEKKLEKEAGKDYDDMTYPELQIAYEKTFKDKGSGKKKSELLKALKSGKA